MILEFFLHHLNPCFLTQHLSFPLLYLPIGICCERILGDQSVVITKDFICYFEEADVCVRVVLSSGAVEVRPRRASELACVWV